MSHVYDIESDQVKCNFCTQWFKCTLHFASIQRYSLKVCHKCFNNFNYTILHPDSYRIYKVILLDSNIDIPITENYQTHLMHQLIMKLEIDQQEIKDKIFFYFEEKIKAMMQEMKIRTKRVEQDFSALKVTVMDKKCKQLPSKDDLLLKMAKLKETPFQNWLSDPPKLLKSGSSAIIPLREKPSKHSNKQNMQNMNQNRKNKESVKMFKGLKQKITNMQDSKCKVTQSYTNEPPILDNSRPRSKSKSTKSLSVSFCSSPKINYQDRDLEQIRNLLNSHRQGHCYLPYQVQPQQTMIAKNESLRTQADSIYDLRSRTTKGNELIELIGAQASKINFQCYLKSLGPQPSAKIVRIIKTGITDYEFDSLLRFLSIHQGVETLIVTNNRLTQISVVALQNFINRHPDSKLKRVYLGSNKIVRERALSACRMLSQGGMEVCL